MEQALFDISNWPGPPPGGWTDADVERIRERAREALSR